MTEREPRREAPQAAAASHHHAVRGVARRRVVKRARAVTGPTQGALGESRRFQPAAHSRIAGTPGELRTRDGAFTAVDRIRRATTDIIRRVNWESTGKAERKASELTTELRNGLTLARSSPASPPTTPAWVTARVRLHMRYDTRLSDKKADEAAKAEAIFGKWPTENAQKANMAKALNMDTAAFDEEYKEDPAAMKKRWKDAHVDRVSGGSMKGLEKELAETVQKRMIGTDPTDPTAGKFKWNEVFNNSDGDLPGVKGAGGYREYYAEPAPGDPPTAGFWGQNRVLRADTVDPNVWFVTDDHYTTYVKVSDA